MQRMAEAEMRGARRSERVAATISVIDDLGTTVSSTREESGL
jgi:hypothetical protein